MSDSGYRGGPWPLPAALLLLLTACGPARWLPDQPLPANPAPAGGAAPAVTAAPPDEAFAALVAAVEERGQRSRVALAVHPSPAQGALVFDVWQDGRWRRKALAPGVELELPARGALFVRFRHHEHGVSTWLLPVAGRYRFGNLGPGWYVSASPL